MKREYRGQRSLEAITDYVRDLLKDPVKELESPEDVEKVDVSINIICCEFLLLPSSPPLSPFLHDLTSICERIIKRA